MAIRKIPLTRRPYLLPDGLELDETDAADDVETPEDPAVEDALSTARALILKDRALNDKVRITLSSSWTLLTRL